MAQTINLKMYKDSNYKFVDATEADQGVAGDGLSVKDIVDAVGSTKKATMVFGHSGTGNTTTYTFSTSETITSNFDIIVENGVVISIATGITVTCEGTFSAGPFDIFTLTGTGKWSFSDGSVDCVYAEWWGAVADGSTDSQAAIEYAADSLANGGVIQLLTGDYNVNATITILEDYILIKGHGPRATSITGDLAVTPILQFGDASNRTDWCRIEGFEITRAAGTIPAASVGVYWYNYVDCYQEDMFIERHAYCEHFDHPSSQSGRFHSYNCQYANAKTAYTWLASTIDMEFASDYFGLRDGGESEDPDECLKVSEDCNGCLFTACQFIPTGTANTTDLISVIGSSGNYPHDWKMTGCYGENLKYFIETDANCTQVNSFQVSGGRYGCQSGVFNINAATQLSAFRASNVDFVYAITATDFLRCSFTGCGFNGGTITGADNTNTLVFVGNHTTATLTFAGTWGEIAVVGNVGDGCTVTDSIGAATSKVFANNA